MISSGSELSVSGASGFFLIIITGKKFLLHGIFEWDWDQKRLPHATCPQAVRLTRRLPHKSSCLASPLLAEGEIKTLLSC